MLRNKSVVQLAQKYDTDKKMNDGKKCFNGILGHDYAVHYDNVLKNLEVSTMLEIGVSWGASIKMWDEYFDRKTLIYGVDINEKRFRRKNLETPNIKIRLGDQGSIPFLEGFKDISFDFIVDDGSHRMKHQQVSFKTLFKYLRSGGVYVIEDLHTSKHKHFYDSKNETTTIELLKNLKAGKQYKSNYLTEEEYQYLLLNVESVDLFVNNTICFIKKI